jgi:type II secretion system protein G
VTPPIPARLRAFTLIELLIVVAIIAILAAIAVPNFLEAQTRAKLSRMKTDLRTMSVGLESYRVDNNAYPLANSFSLAGARNDPAERTPTTNPKARVLERLSTPVSYLTSGFLPEPFQTRQRTGTINSSDGSFGLSPSGDGDALNADIAKLYKYSAVGVNAQGITAFANNDETQNPPDKASFYFVLHGCGPDGIYRNPGGLMDVAATDRAVANNIYDATNGTVSDGTIYRLGGTSSGTPGVDYGARFFEVVSRIGQ